MLLFCLHSFSINDLGQERLNSLNTQIDRIIGQLDNPSADRIERITASEYRKFLTREIGTDPLIDIEKIKLL